MLIRPALTNLPATKKFKESNEKAGSSSTGVLIHHEYKVRDVKNGKATVLKIRDNLPGIIASIKSRFESFEDEIYQSVIAICDHRRWDYEDNSYGVKGIAALYEHFQDPLSENDFNKDLAVKEFKDIKRIVKHRYRHLTPQQMWESIITNHSVNHRHITMLGELILCIEWASSTVERGFSITNRMLVPSRQSLSKKRLNNLLMLRVNVPILSTLDPHYEEKLIAKAVELYTPNKYHNTKGKASKATKLTYDRSTDIVDLFLPQTQDEYFPSEYLADDGHLIFSDEDHIESDEEGEGDSEMYAIDEEEDVEERDEGQ